jgi:hypothetical protein
MYEVAVNKLGLSGVAFQISAGASKGCARLAWAADLHTVNQMETQE